MSYYSRQFSSSPIITMPRPFSPAPLGLGGFSHQPHIVTCTDTTPFGSAVHAVPRTSMSLSRKRSRDEASENLDNDAATYTTRDVASMSNLDKGGNPGVTIANDAALSAKAGNAFNIATGQAAFSRPSILALGSRKSQRKNSDSDSISDSTQSFLACDVPMTNSAQPVVDDFTLHLGIGWRKISDEAHVQAAARGWARFIENHYPLTSVVIRLESKGLQSYLAEASEGFFLFAENLREGRFVSKTIDGAINNLRSSPPVFDGAEKLVAGAFSSSAVTSMMAQSQLSAPPASDAADIMMG